MNRSRHAYRAVPVLATCLLAAACTYERAGPARLHFEEFRTAAPRDDTVTVCHAYGCQEKTPFTFTAGDLGHLAALMDDVRRDDTAEEERRAIAYAVAWIEWRVGNEVGTASDRPSIDVFGSNDPTQQDCVDEATNTTSYLTVLARNGLLRHHTVERPFAKGNLLLGIWPHWTAVIEDRAGQRYAVDSSNGANAANPEILAAERWYMDSGGPDAPATRPAPLTTSSLRQTALRRAGRR